MSSYVGGFGVVRLHCLTVLSRDAEKSMWGLGKTTARTFRKHVVSYPQQPGLKAR